MASVCVINMLYSQIVHWLCEYERLRKERECICLVAMPHKQNARKVEALGTCAIPLAGKGEAFMAKGEAIAKLLVGASRGDGE